MALSAKRYAEVDMQLQQVQNYLLALTHELAQLDSADPACQPCQASLKADKQIAQLRYLLAVAEARRQVSEKDVAPVTGAARAVSPAATTIHQAQEGSALPAFKWLATLLDTPSRRI